VYGDMIIGPRCLAGGHHN